eukprot:8031532-Pyramimonas_sp.AAC.1
MARQSRCGSTDGFSYSIFVFFTRVAANGAVHGDDLGAGNALLARRRQVGLTGRSLPRPSMRRA